MVSSPRVIIAENNSLGWRQHEGHCSLNQKIMAWAASPVYLHDDVIQWKHFSRYWPCVRGIHRSPVNSPHKDQWLGTLMFSLTCAWTKRWANNWDAGDLRRHRAHYDVIVMIRLPIHPSFPINIMAPQRMRCAFQPELDDIAISSNSAYINADPIH